MKIIAILKLIILMFAMSIKSHAGSSNVSDLLKKIEKRQIIVEIDYTEELKLVRPATQIVLGNPLIADVKVRDDQSLFLIGKSPGRTNMLVYGRDGKLSERNTLIVRDPTNLFVTLQNGANSRTHYDCISDCQRVVRIEDQGEAYQDQIQKITSHVNTINASADQSRAADLQAQQEQLNQQ